ncbi:MAG: phage portal protein [Gemmatimonadales bacterium]|nr:phage portal protein [Gemmatimonadales bacterium]
MPEYQAVLTNIMELVAESEFERIQAIENSFAMYNCRHSQFFPRFAAETDDDYKQRIGIDAYNINFVRRIVDTLTAYLYGNEIERKCEDETANTLMVEHWRRTNIMLYMLKLKRTASIGGTGYTVARWLPKDMPDAKVPIHYVPVDPAYVTLIFDPAEPTRVRGAIIHYLYDDVTGVTMVDRHRGNKLTPHSYVEYITDDEHLIWIDDKLQDGRNGQRDLMNFEQFGGTNPFGSVDVVFTVYRNYEINQSVYGVSDIKDVVPLNLKLDERKTDEGVVISYHSLPALVGDFEMSELIRGPSRMWQIPQDRELDYLTWDNNIGASLEHCDKLTRDLITMGRLPEAALFAEGIRQLRSAPALELAFAPAKEAIKEQRTTFGDAEVRRIQGDLTMLEMLGNKQFKNKNVELVWPHKFLPIDSFVEIETSRTRRELGLDTWEQQLKREYPNMSDEQIAEHMEKCKADPLFGKSGGSPFSSPAEKSTEQEEPVRAPGGAGE